jgi:DNA polymerase-3 subunit epsilon
MLTNLALNRPLAVIDLETTGVDTQTARIVELSIQRIDPSGHTEQHTLRINPGVPIPPEATAVHGITDAAVAAEPPFGDVAPGLLDLLDGCDLCGFNLKRFDLRVLYLEFLRAGLTLSLDDMALIDPMEIFHAYERRDLTTAVRFYLGRDHAGAHSAAADAIAAAEVLDAMLARYADLPRTPAGLHVHFRDSNAVDSGGRFVRVEGEIRFAFGKYRGQPLCAVAASSPAYLRWILDQDFMPDTKEFVAAALSRKRRAGPAHQPREARWSPSKSQASRLA